MSSSHVRRLGVVARDEVAGVVRVLRSGDLARERPGEDERRSHADHGPNRGPARAEQSRQHEQQNRDGQRHDQRPLHGVVREREVAVRHLRDRKPERVRVRDILERVVGRHEQVGDEGGRRRQWDPAQPRPLEPKSGADEDERDEIDEVPFDDHGSEGRREIRGFDGGVEAEAEERGEQERGERAQRRRPLPRPWAERGPARAATTGSTPSPMTKAPPAQTPYSIIRPR